MVHLSSDWCIKMLPRIQKIQRSPAGFECTGNRPQSRHSKSPAGSLKCGSMAEDQTLRQREIKSVSYTNGVSNVKIHGKIASIWAESSASFRSKYSKQQQTFNMLICRFSGFYGSLPQSTLRFQPLQGCMHLQQRGGRAGWQGVSQLLVDVVQYTQCRLIIVFWINDCFACLYLCAIKATPIIENKVSHSECLCLNI